MILYQLALLKIVKYFGLDQYSKEEELRMKLLKQKPKKDYKTKLKIDPAMDLRISILLSVITILIFITIPFTILESPCEELLKNGFYTTYTLAKFIETHWTTVDNIIVVLFVILVTMSVKTILDAIKRTDLSISPWVERGKYVLPTKEELKAEKMRKLCGEFRFYGSPEFERFCEFPVFSENLKIQTLTDDYEIPIDIECSTGNTDESSC